MDQRTLLYISLVFMSFLIWQAWQLDHAPRPATSNTNVPAQSLDGGLSPAANPAAQGQDLPEVPTRSGSTVPTVGNAASAATGGQIITVKTDVFELQISTVGGDIIDVKLPTYPIDLEMQDVPVQLLRSTPPRYLAQSGLLHDNVSGADQSGRAPNHYAIFTAGSNYYEIPEGEDKVTVDLLWTGDDGVEVAKKMTFRRGQFVIDVDFEVNNNSPDYWTGRQYRQLRHGPAGDSDGSFLLYTYIGGAYYTDKYNKIPFDDFAKKPVNVDVAQGGWISIPQHYFLSAWYSPKEISSRELIYTKAVDVPGGSESLIGMRSDSVSVAPGESTIFSTHLYIGPKKQSHLEQLATGLELTIDYGIFTIFSKPIFWLLSAIYNVVGNWGWAIIILTIMIKLLFYKLSAASYRSMAKMKTAAPKLQEVKERFSHDKQAQQQAMMDLYKKEKINPLGGCLPILIQIPVFIALYWVLLESVELRQAPWILWIKDMSIKDPFFILPLLMGVTMFIQQKLNPPPPDPIQAKLMMALPFVFTIFFAFFPAGLVLYWFVNNLLSIMQQYVITKKIENDSKRA